MLLCILLACVCRPAISLGLLQTRLRSASVNAAQAKGAQHTELEQLRERAAKLNQEIAELANVDVPVVGSGDADMKAAAAAAFELPATGASWVPVPKANLRKAFAPKKTSVAHAVIEQAEVPDVLALPQSHHGVKKMPATVTVRPNAGGKPEVVSFGLFAKTFYGVNVKANNFVIDIVQTYKWKDDRVKALIEAGKDHLTLSKKESEMKIWLPGMVITNRDIKKYDLISTSVTINKKGEVFKVERAMAIVKCGYILNDFPYDKQDLVVKVASSKYMINEVVLEPAKKGIGASDGLLDGEAYDFVKVGASAFADINGALKKSRGLLTINVKRNLGKYTQSHIVPAFLLVCISWGVFWFPFIAPFITPRLALSILTLLNFTYLTVSSSHSLPAGAPYNWNDVGNQGVMIVMFTTVCMNIFEECVFHQLKLDELARTINHELKVFMPFISVTMFLIILACHKAAGHVGHGDDHGDGWMTIEGTSAVTKTYLFLIIIGYAAYCGHRVRVTLEQKRSGSLSKGQSPAMKPAPSPPIKPAIRKTDNAAAASGGDGGGGGGGD